MRARTSALVLLASLAGCVAPATSTSDYEAKAVETAEVVLGSVQTALLVVDVVRDEGAFGPYVGVTLSDAERDAAAAAATFLTVQPPNDDSDAIRAELSLVLDRANDALGQARIAARRERFAEVVRIGPRLSEVARELDGLIGRYG